MSYLALARKWRPQLFNEVIGQPHVVKALLNALAQQRMHHAYLFSGTRGVGKTTIARLLAKALNCEQLAAAEGQQSEPSEPCGQCQSCRDIQEGRFVDLIEIDAASRTKVEDTREILENVQYRPTRGRYKVYLIDEVHMLSRHSFNALLKTLEEPPPHVKFLLATTDPQKLPITILSRCLQFNLKSLSVDEIAKHLAQILNQERIESDPDGIRELAVAARGSMRDGLSLTDQAIAFGSGKVVAEQVSRMLGTASRSQVVALLQALFASDQERMFTQLQQVVAFSPDIDRLLSDLLNALHQIAMMQFRPTAYAGRTGFEAELLSLSQALDPQMVQLYYRIILEGRKELPWAPDTVAAIEMTLLRCLAFVPVDSPESTSRPESTQAAASPAARPFKAPEQPQRTSPLSALKQQLSQQEQHEPADKAPAPQQSALAPQADSTAAATSASISELQRPSNTETQPAPAAPPAIKAPVMPAPPPMAADEPFVSDQEIERELALQQDHLLSMAESQGFDPAVPDSSPVAQPPIEQQPSQPEPATETLDANPDTRASTAAQGKSELSSANVDGVLKARHMLRSMRKAKEGDSGKKPEPSPVGRSAPSPGGGVVAPAGQQRLEATDRPQQDAAIPDSGKSNDVQHAVVAEADSPQITELASTQVAQSVRLTETSDWFDVVQQSGLSGLLRQLAMHSVGQRSDDGYLLTLQPEQKHLAGERLQQQLAQHLSGVLQQNISVAVTVGQVAGAETPFERLQREYQERLQQAHVELEADPAVIALKQRFAAEIDHESVKPL